MEPIQIEQYMTAALVVYAVISVILFFVKAKTTKTYTTTGDFGEKHEWEAGLLEKLFYGGLMVFWPVYPFLWVAKIVRNVLWWILK